MMHTSYTFWLWVINLRKSLVAVQSFKKEALSLLFCFQRSQADRQKVRLLLLPQRCQSAESAAQGWQGKYLPVCTMVLLGLQAPLLVSSLATGRWGGERREGRREGEVWRGVVYNSFIFSKHDLRLKKLCVCVIFKVNRLQQQTNSWKLLNRSTDMSKRLTTPPTQKSVFLE